MSSVRSINEPQNSRLFNFSAPSINEPPAFPPLGAPTLSGINPSTAVIGGADLTMTATGTSFTPASIITFNGGDEPTSFVSGTSLTTVIKPSTATTPGTYPVTVANEIGESAVKGFTFTVARSSGEVADDVDPSDPDELEDEIEQAEEEGEFKSVHASRTTVTVKKKTKR